MLQLEDRLVPAGQITGQAFLDFNSNGLIDTATTLPNDGGGTYIRQTDQGVGGIVVQAFDAANVQRGIATTAADGTYTLAAAGTGGYRLEFSNLPGGNFYGPQGTNPTPPPAGGATSVQFVPDGNSNNRNLSLSVPTGYSDNPLLITNEYRVGDQSGLLPSGPRLGTNTSSTAAVIVSFPYSAGTSSQTSTAQATVPTAHALAVEARFVGATWGLAQDTSKGTVLASAFTKKHTGYGPNGPGAIYTMGTTGTAATLWLDLGTATVGGNFRAGYTNNDDYFADSFDTGWDAVGKTSLGGLAINDANTAVYVMNLADRRLYTIPVNPDGSANAAGITSILIPLPGNATGVTGGNTRGDLRPFAVEYRNGLVYVGMVNSAETTQARSDLRGYVYTYNPGTGQWSAESVVNEGNATSGGFRLDYNRAPSPITPSFGGSDNFNPWSPTFRNVNPSFGPNNNAVKYPQPMLSGLAFDGAGNLLLAIRDRAGDQLGNQVASDPAQPNQLDLGISSGDLLKSGAVAGGTWRLESAAAAGGPATGGAGNNQGPGGGEFFYQDDYDFGTHIEVQSGAVAYAPGFPDIISTVFDPVRLDPARTTKAGGIRWYNGADGTLSKSYQIYDSSDAGTFGKATGLGDLLVVQPPAGREIGNRVWNDVNANGRQDPGENPLVGVQTILFFNGAPLATATTDAAGEYYFSSNAGANRPNKIFGLDLARTGNYTIGIPVVQGPLAGLILTTADIGGNAEDRRDSDFVLNVGANRADFAVPTILAGQSDHTFDAGFRLPNTARISGFVYADRNNNGAYEPGLPNNEPSIGGVTVVLTGTDSVGNAITPLTTVTDGAGFYQFLNLVNGTYTVSETQPPAFLDGKDTPGTLGGSNAVNDALSGIVLPPGGDSQNNNFGELEPAALNGFVYLDANDDGIFQAGETPIPGVTVVLTGSNDLGAIAAQTLTTNGAGFYSYTNLRPGTYRVSEAQPAAFADGRDTPGTPGGGTSAVNDVIDAITLTANLTSPNNNFGERPLAASSLSGFVYYDLSDDGLRAGPPGEPGIGGATVTLTGTTALGAAIAPRTAVTDINGFYRFDGLQAGTYTVVETQPPGYLDGKDTAGNFGGSVTNDAIAAVTLANSTAGVNYNFGELLPAALNGFVYLDANDDGIFQPGETPIPGTTVILTGEDSSGTIAPQTLATNAAGFYSFGNLRPGTYRVRELQPAGFLDGKDTPGNPGGGRNPVDDIIDAIALTPGLTSPNNNFGERLPPIPPPTGQLSGYVYRDPNVNGARETPLGERGIAGTKIVLFAEGPNGPVAVQTAFTASDGFYQFRNLAPGVYRTAETQPLGFFDGLDTVGTTGGSNAVNDVLSGIAVVGGANSQNNNFGEIQSVNLFGYVWIDNNRNGIFDPGEAGIPNAVVSISGTAFAGTPIANTLNASQASSGLSIVTDANGRYDFFRLPPGSYSLAQTNTPAGLSDFASQNAAPGLPVQLSSLTTFGGIGLQNPAPGPLNFGKVFQNAPIDPNAPPSKESFLGSSLLGAVRPTANPLVGPPTFPVRTNPSFTATNATSAKPVYLAAGAGAGFSPVVRVFDYRSGSEVFRFTAFAAGFLGGVEVATGDINGDGTPDIIAAAGAGGGPHVKVFDGLTGAEIRSFFAYDPNFRGGVMVASGDVDGDGFDDIITGAMSSGAPHVKAFSGRTGAEIASFFAFDQNLTTGVRVAAGDLDGDGRADIIASTGAGTPPRVRAFDGRTRNVISDFAPFSGFAGGLYIAAGDLDGDGKSEIFVGAGAGGGPRISTFRADGTEINSFFSGDVSNTSGVRVAAKDLDGDGRADIIAGAGLGSASRVVGYSGAGLGVIEDFYVFDSGVRTGIYVG